MDVNQFCVKLAALDLTNAQRAVALLWFYDRDTTGIRKSAGDLARVIQRNGLGNPNQTTLAPAIARLRLTLQNKAGFQLKPTAKPTVQAWVQGLLDSSPADHDGANGYLPEELFAGTRGYIEKIGNQVNGCVHYHFFDAASVMLRRLIETLLIECYEHLGIGSRIKDADGNYSMLSGIITDAVDNGGLSLGRETKKVLKELKTVGDRAAHNRRYNAVAADLERIRIGTRLVVDELIQLATLRRAA
ncbi:hypothetical protein [Aeoliella mucimassa]|uniref:DUF4145 domain-containing protein n=1 Tax=Aeoliella mucimassa TaxID=2527972 RepID=A0A518AVQ9_9BACT|nr:hypothetical protein [Aeoliella mucimassa]QDU58800.1 hypothetical protein Pan181_50400 [Aeoliella mucimassa]